MRRGLGAGVGGSNPGRGIIPLGAWERNSPLISCHKLQHCGDGPGKLGKTPVVYEAHVLQSVVIQDGQTGRRTSACCCRYAGSPGSIQGKKQNVVVD